MQVVCNSSVEPLLVGAWGGPVSVFKQHQTNIRLATGKRTRNTTPIENGPSAIWHTVEI